MAHDLNRYFQAEAEDLLTRIAAALERWREGASSPESLRDLRRWAHTLKGAAQVVRREDIAAAAHRFESLLEKFGESGANPALLAAAVALTAEMRQVLIHGAQSTAAPADVTKPKEPEMESLRVELGTLDRLLQSINECGIFAAELNRLTVPLERAADVAAMLGRDVGNHAAGQGGTHAAVLAEETAEAIAGARSELESATRQVQSQIDALRAQVESLRLVRAENIVPILEESIRMAAAAAGKEIGFETSGGELELDAHLLIGARDALIQLVRNAIAHGIESPGERLGAGKPRVGRIRVEFRRQGSRNVISVADDGRGIDFEALRKEAIRRGWLKPGEAGAATAQQLTEYLLRPGVSTLRSATPLAGRGVGLDLVSGAVARMKGDLRITAEPGQGTTVAMRIPAAMNSAPVIMLQAGARIFGVPLDAVGRTASLAGLSTLADRFVLDGAALPMVPLAVAAGIESGPPSIAVEIPAHPRSFLLGVDALVGMKSTVIYTLPEYIAAEPWILGASVESDGQLRLVLDPSFLASRLDELLQRPVEKAAAPPLPLPILVIDDSLTTRMMEQSIFEMEGYTVDLACSAEEALAMARQRDYGLFLVDVEMPGMDGIAFVEYVQKEPRLRDTPAILVTSRNSIEDRNRGREAGAREYVVKSEFDQRSLLRRVRELMRER